jgi:hypothetical protein
MHLVCIGDRTLTYDRPQIYREDDLERELERYKEKLARSQRPSGESMLTNGTSKSKSNIKVITSTVDRCELCDSKVSFPPPIARTKC